MSTKYSYADLSQLSLDEMLEVQGADVEVSAFKNPPQAIYTGVMAAPKMIRADDGKTARYVIDVTPTGIEEALNLAGNEAFVEAVASGDAEAVAKLMPEKIQMSFFFPAGIANVIRDFGSMIPEDVLTNGSNGQILEAIGELAGSDIRFKVTHYVKKKAGEEDKTYVNFKDISLLVVEEAKA